MTKLMNFRYFRYLFGVIFTFILLYAAFSEDFWVDEENESLDLNNDQVLAMVQSSRKNGRSLFRTISKHVKRRHLNKMELPLVSGKRLRETKTNGEKNDVENNFNIFIQFDEDAEKREREKAERDEKECLARKATNNTAKDAFTETETDSKNSPGAKRINSYRRAYYSSKTVITPVNQAFLISNKHFCKNSSPDLIIFIPSSPHNADRRSAIRTTYGTLSRDRKSSINGIKVDFVVRVVFIVGKSVSLQLTNSVYEESKKHGDIVLVDLIDSYRDLTKKVLHCLKWVNEYCSSVSYVMKADDDVFVNVASLTKKLIEHRRTKPGTVFGYMYKGLKEVSRTGKWAVSYTEYPFDNYPDYVSGTSYTMTINLVPKILYSAQRLPHVPIEDAFITGIIAHKIHGAKVVHWGANSRWHCSVPDPCHLIKRRISMTNMTPQLVYKSWYILQTNGVMPNGTRCV